MKLRSFILVSCMVIVPALAMFSHHLPPLRWPSAWGMTAESPRLPDAPVTAPAASAGDAVDGGAAGGSSVAAGPGSATADRAAANDVAVAVTAPPRPVAPAPGFDPDDATSAARGRLAALGAIGIECQPAPGGMVLGSCRVAVDASGQLQRLFQAAAPDSATAFDSLANEVTAWRRRTGPP